MGTVDIQRLAQDSRDIKRVEIPTIQFAVSQESNVDDSISISQESPMPPTPNNERKESPLPPIQEPDDDDNKKVVKEQYEVSPPATLSRNSTPATITSIPSLKSLNSERRNSK